MAEKVQFSLRTIFAVTAVVAVVVAEAVAFPEWIANIFGFTVMVLLPSAFVAQIIYARGAGRAFGVGATTAWLVAVLSVPFLGGWPGTGLEGIVFSIAWCLTLAGGGLAVLVRWLSQA